MARALGCALALSACAVADPVEEYLADAAALERGRALFIGTCTGYCHVEGRSNGDIPNLFDGEWRHGGGNQDVFQTIANGVPGTQMVGFRGVLPEGDEDIWRIVAYLRSAAR